MQQNFMKGKATWRNNSRHFGAWEQISTLHLPERTKSRLGRSGVTLSSCPLGVGSRYLLLASRIDEQFARGQSGLRGEEVCL